MYSARLTVRRSTGRSWQVPRYPQALAEKRIQVQQIFPAVEASYHCRAQVDAAVQVLAGNRLKFLLFGSYLFVRPSRGIIDLMKFHAHLRPLSLAGYSARTTT